MEALKIGECDLMAVLSKLDRLSRRAEQLSQETKDLSNEICELQTKLYSKTHKEL